MLTRYIAICIYVVICIYTVKMWIEETDTCVYMRTSFSLNVHKFLEVYTIQSYNSNMFGTISLVRRIKIENAEKFRRTSCCTFVFSVLH